MKKLILLLVVVISTISYGQVPSYYNDVNLNLSGQALRSELADKITRTHTTFISYTPGVWDALKKADIDPNNSSRVVLIYGFNDADGDLTTDRTRGINNNGGGNNEWNREHTYPRSLGNPNLGSTGPGSDAHHLRPADVKRNSSRGSRKFADGSGNSRITSQGNWYPGDEFKGDVARMMMYMYLHYGNRCLPKNVGVGSTVSGDNNMIQLFLEWNAEDPVSALELQRNPAIQNIQGNRNPFIDNPAFATKIWGGPQAEDRFGDTPGGGGDNTLCTTTVSSFPYTESFESNLGSWKQAGSNDDFNWTRRSGSTPSSNTGPSAAGLGSNYIYMESSSPNFSNKRAILFSPCYDITTARSATFSFQYHMFGASTMGSLSVEASLDGKNWTSVWSRSGNQGNSWETATINLSNYLGKKVQLRFNGVTGTTWQGDMAIDALNFSTSTNTEGDSAETDLNFRITFDNYPEETSWEIRNENNNIVYSGGTYPNQRDGSTINISRALRSGCYNLVFTDSFGDGICCSNGNGSYRLTNTVTGTVLASGSSFRTRETTNFCVGTSSRNSIVAQQSEKEALPDHTFSIYPIPARDYIVVQMDHSNDAEYTISNSMGQIIKQGKISGKEIGLTTIQPGLYFLSVKTDQSTITKRFVIK